MLKYPHAKLSARSLDQFYTNRSIVPLLIKEVEFFAQKRLKLNNSFSATQWLEPSAGDGAFLDFLPNHSIGLDLEPASPNVIKTDFLLWSINDNDPQKNKQWIVIGNPPFGKNSSLAIKFFNHAAIFADIISFIVPRTFEKISVQNRLNQNFFLEKEIVIDPNSFIFEGNNVSVPCVFQIWSRFPKNKIRLKINHPKTHVDFQTIKDLNKADFAFQRVGAQAGKVKDMTSKSISPSSHHFIYVVDRKNIKNVRKKFESIDFSLVKSRTAGNPSISLTELILLYSEI